jgi:hypothetical protein
MNSIKHLQSQFEVIVNLKWVKCLFVETTKLIDWLRIELRCTIINVHIAKSTTEVCGDWNVALRMCGERVKQEENKSFVAKETTEWQNCECFVVW